MKILVYPHDLGIGGSQLNAIEIAAEIQRRGHDICIAGRPGALNSRIDQLGLEFVELPQPWKRPSRGVAAALRGLVRARGLEVVHGFEWPPTLEALWGTWGTAAVPCSTVMSMAVAPFIPHWMALLVGTEQILDLELTRGRTQVALLEPPVDLTENNPAADHHAAAARASWGFEPDDIVVGVVTRLAHEMKLEGILAAIDVMANTDDSRLRLVVAGDGPAMPSVRTAAAAANRNGHRPRVVILGELDDPRPVYAASDVLLGMGGSALRAMAFAKPLIVQGERGFWRTLDETSVDDFLWTGWYGVGNGVDAGPELLRKQLAPLLDDTLLRERLGAFGRRLIERRFSIEAAADRQLAFYDDALHRRPSRSTQSLGTFVGGIRYSAYYAAKRWRRLTGGTASDDFNARPAVATAAANPGRREAEGSSS